MAIAVVCGAWCCGAMGAEWPPGPRLEVGAAVEDAAPLPASVQAEPADASKWRCTFRFRPPTAAKVVALVGSFNAWGRDTNVMQGPNADGEWTAQVELETGVYQYKFLIDNEHWYSDPVNLDRVPDSYGDYNSLVRLGRLAQLKASTAKLGDGQIDAGGLLHRPPAALYIQPAGPDSVSIRYRTMANDMRHVWLAVKDAPPVEMTVACGGPLFTYWQATVAVAPGDKPGATDVRGFEYTFLLDDGGGRFADPYGPYYYTLAPAPAMRTPEWARNAVWYQVVLDRFRNGDASNDPKPVRAWTSEWFTPAEWEGKDGQTFYQNFVFDRAYGGDLAGLEAKLLYLKELGVSALYLTPVFKAPSYHKYDVQNYVHIDDHFGSNGDYAAIAAQEDLLDPGTWKWTKSDERFLLFVRKAHELGFRVIIDAVFNHVGIEHPAFADVLKNGKRSRYADWFDVTSWEPFAYRGWAGFPNMPAFKKDRDGFASPSVKAHLFAVTRRWMDPNGDGNPRDGVDGWRLDVPNDIPQQFWAEWRALVKGINDDALITGEVWHRADQWLDGNHFDAVMNYEFARTAVQWLFDQERKLPASAAAARFAELRLAYPAAATFALQNLIDSHDTDRLASMVLNPDREYDRQNRVQDNNPDYNNAKPGPEAYARARLAALLQMTYIGAPLVYYGDEVGMWGADDPSNRKPMLWKDLEPYEQPAENAVTEDQLAFYQQVIALRKDHPALRSGAFADLLADDVADVWAFLRTAATEQAVVVLNASNTPRVVHVPLPDGAPTAWTTIYGEGGELTASDSKLTVSVPAVGGVVLQAPAK